MRYTVGGRCFRVSAQTSDREEALRLLAEAVGEERSGRCRLTVRDLCAAVESTRRSLRKRSGQRYTQAVERIRKYWGEGTALESIKKGSLYEYVEALLEAGYSKATVEVDLSVMKRGFKLLEDRGARTPGFPRLQVDNARTEFFAEEEWRTFRAALGEEIGRIGEFLHLTGWRISEALGLTWRKVDFNTSELTLPSRDSKNHRARKLPLGPFPELETLLLEQRSRVPEKEPRVFPVSDSTFRRKWEIVNAALGWEKKPHDLRRTAVRNLVKAGVPRSWAMAITGHETEAVFERYNLVEEAEAVEAIGRLREYLHKSAQSGTEFSD